MLAAGLGGVAPITRKDRSVVITRRVETTVEMREGETLIIGGLRNQEKEYFVQKIPILGDIPVIGNLFRKTRTQTIEQELVVMVTPRFVKPMTADQVPEFPNLLEPEE